MVVDEQDNIYVVDNKNKQIQKFDSSGELVSHISTKISSL
jgi:hypothetical protein